MKKTLCINYPEIIVSLTTYPPRINTVHITIESILNQTLKAKKIILWLALEEFPNKYDDLPIELLNLQKKGLEIEWCNNIRSYKKLIPSLERYWNSVIITLDDDLIFSKRTVEILYKCHKKYKNDIIAHRVTRLYYSDVGELVILPRLLYINRISLSNYKYVIKEPSFYNKLSGGAGALYPPGSLHGDVLNKEIFMEIAPTNDDIWFWLQAVRNNTRVRVPKKHIPTLHYVPGTQNVGLKHINDKGEKLFFVQLKNIIEKYPDITNKLKYEDTKNSKVIALLKQSEKKISVIKFVNKWRKKLKKKNGT